MLSDHERKTLEELERRFMADDPEFPQLFDARARRLHSNRHFGMSFAIAVATVAGALFFTIMLATVSLAGALAFAAVIGLIWEAWRRSDPAPTAQLTDPRDEP
ncbi:DUF3040 domain-containing protein [Pseudonocardia sp. NPDC049154]|uniref:DUF3040 domain-containing protein n=1 Tax=Pseudonocardia sp. NPDC049154 TaxID=3155501 RepID=UPI0033FE97D4